MTTIQETLKKIEEKSKKSKRNVPSVEPSVEQNIADAKPATGKTKLEEDGLSSRAQNERSLPSVFIGSSTEGIIVAREVELQLQSDAITTIWKDNIFEPGRGTLESLMNQLEEFDFAVMVLSPDDLTESRSLSYTSPRDNVIFELGLFMGRLGSTRVFIVHEKNASLKLPSDLAGISVLEYTKRDNLAAALSPACTPIIKMIHKSGFSERRSPMGSSMGLTKSDIRLVRK